uniref:Membrane transporter protein n=1 Tax=viral metagenome TaxID=1070528 RepID=A0A6C0K143_9ZZZZ
MNKTSIFIIIGLLSGIINGLTGLGHAGAILIGLTLSNTISNYSTIIGTTLYSQLLPVVAFGVWEFYKRGQIDFYAGNIILTCLVFSVFIGAWLKQFVSNKITKTTTAILLLLTAFKFLLDVYNE